MRIKRYALGPAFLFLFWQVVTAQVERMSHSDTEKTIERIRDFSDSFENNFDRNIHHSAVDSSARKDIRRAVERFQEAADQLEDHYDQDDAAVPWVRAVLREAAVIDSFMSRKVASPGLESQWLLLRQELDLLANSYGVTPEWPSRLARVEPPPPAVVVPAPAPSTVRMPDLLSALQTDSIAFQASVRNTASADAINEYTGDFIVSVDRLNRSYSSGSLSADDVNEVLIRAESIEAYMKNHPVSVSAQESWSRLRDDLVRLGTQFNLSPAWFTR